MSNEDYIPVRVQLNGRWVEYRLSYENFGMIQPILNESPHSDVKDKNSPEMLKEIFTSTFAPIARMGEKTILYNLLQKPNDMTKDEVVEYYHRTKFLLFESDSQNTQVI